MTQEEKAKRFDEVLAMAKECITYIPDDAVNKYMLNMFPELKESEDEKVKKAIIHILYENYTDAAVIEGVEIVKIVAWLEKQGEQKPTWSKEDDVRLQACIDVLQAKSINGKVDTIMTKWLKSLKERYTWKPSDEQMRALEHFVRSIGESGYASSYDNNTKLLYSLLEQLKKLREE